jgi:hypothetical protein
MDWLGTVLAVIGAGVYLGGLIYLARIAKWADVPLPPSFWAGWRTGL